MMIGINVQLLLLIMKEDVLFWTQTPFNFAV